MLALWECKSEVDLQKLHCFRKREEGVGREEGKEEEKENEEE